MGHEIHHAETPGLKTHASNGNLTPYLRARGISKSFGHVRALQNVDIDIFDHEVLAIVGDNGAGKSTLTKILSGVLQPDHGDIHIGGEKVRITSARKAHEFGVATVFQTLALVNCRDVACNLFLGREPTFWRFFVDRRKMIADARIAFAELGVNIPTLLAEAGELSGGQRQCVAIARATSQKTRVIIMDEPTAALGVKESGNVLDLIMRLKAAGRGIVIISHNMHHVFSVADRILVLRRGSLVGMRRKDETTHDEIVAMITGSQLATKDQTADDREGRTPGFAVPGSGE